MLQCVAVCCSVLQYDAVCCSVLQCVAVCFTLEHLHARGGSGRGDEGSETKTKAPLVC